MGRLIGDGFVQKLKSRTNVYTFSLMSSLLLRKYWKFLKHTYFCRVPLQEPRDCARMFWSLAAQNHPKIRNICHYDWGSLFGFWEILKDSV